MSRGTNAVLKEKKVDDKRNENFWGSMAAYMLFALVGEVFFCLILGWFSGNTHYNQISDNFVTSLLQNYNYILGGILLIPVIGYIFQKIKRELKSKIITDDQLMMYGFLGFIVTLVAMIAVCSIVYPVNSSTWYGINSKITVSVFLCFVVLLIIVSIVYGILRIIALSKEKGKLWKTILKYSPIILMVMFLIWTFISCMLAPGAADDIIGAEAAKKAGASPSDVLAKTLNGCYNLKDGFWAFLMYGSAMLSAMIIGKDKIKEKKNLIKVFVLVITVLSVLTLGTSFYLDAKREEYAGAYEQYYNFTSGELNLAKELTSSDFDKIAQNEAYEVFNKWYIYPQKGIFRNSNHFAYVLSIAIIASAGIALTEKEIIKKLIYIFTFTILTWMLIVNNTFGGYLGVLVALLFMFIYVVALQFIDRKNENIKKNKLTSLITMFIIVGVFILVSASIVGGNGKPVAINNIKNFVKDIGIFGNFFVSQDDITAVDISDVSKEIQNAGSERGRTWIKVWELIKQRPMFGYGLECLLFQFSGQFNINEGRTHNLLLQLLATVGIPGTLMYFAALAIVFIRLIKNWKNWDDIEKITTFVGISYMITALTGNSTYYTSPYFMMFLGFVVLTPWKKVNEKENK